MNEENLEKTLVLESLKDLSEQLDEQSENLKINAKKENKIKKNSLIILILVIILIIIIRIF